MHYWEDVHVEQMGHISTWLFGRYNGQELCINYISVIFSTTLKIYAKLHFIWLCRWSSLCPLSEIVQNCLRNFNWIYSLFIITSFIQHKVIHNIMYILHSIEKVSFNQGQNKYVQICKNVSLLVHVHNMKMACLVFYVNLLESTHAYITNYI